MTSAPLHPQLIAAQRAIAAAAGGDKARTVENESIRIGAFVSTGEISESDAVDIIYCASVVHAGGLIEHFGSAGVEQGIRRGLAGRRWLFEPRKVSDDQMRQERPRSAAQVSAIDMEAFLKMEIPPRPTLLTPWLPAQGLAMIYAPRGTGKTRVAHGIAHAIASGSGFLRWTAPAPKRVLLIDGEMPAAALQDMIRSTVSASQYPLQDPSYFKIVAADLLRDGLPDLANQAAQQFYRDVVADADLVIPDNLSTLCRSLKENDADSWTPVQAWALSLRRAGKSALFIHHGGKSGGQRGTSRKEDVLDTVISLRRPPDYSAEQGARFEIHFEKSRGFHGPDAEPFEARLLGDQWAMSSIKSGDDLDTVQALRKQGLSIRDIADRTGLTKSKVGRMVGGHDDEE